MMTEARRLATLVAQTVKWQLEIRANGSQAVNCRGVFGDPPPVQ